MKIKIEVISAVKEAEDYCKAVQNGQDKVQAWEEIVISPYWDKLCCYAPFDLGERKPKAITNIEKLKEQIAVLKLLDLQELRKEFERVTEILPNYDDDPITVALFPSDADNVTVNEQQNGVVGTSLFGNLFIQVNPLIEGFEAWIRYVFAHEYHHTVWGNYWYMLNGGSLENKFIDSLVIDGEADSFALELYPSLRPAWVFGISDREKNCLWEKHYKDIVYATDVVYEKYMFGSEELGIPWCAGYAIGYMLVQAYLKKNETNVIRILEKKPEELICI